MVVKRQNHGRSKKNSGNIRRVRCHRCKAAVPKDKVVRRFNVRLILDVAAKAEVEQNRDEQCPKTMGRLYTKQLFCISCGVHQHITGSRRKTLRKVRHQPSSQNHFGRATEAR